MKWVLLVVVVGLLLVACKGTMEQAREQHVQYKKEVCPCECTK